MARTTRPRRWEQAGDEALVQALIYIRVSSDEQAREGLSLAAQLQACRRYCADKGWLIAGEYRDILSGKRDDRRQYQALVTEAKRLAASGQRVAVVVIRLDRLGRRLQERVNTRAAFKEAGIQTHSVREGGEVNDMMAAMLAAMAEQEVERLAERVMDTRDHNSENGWRPVGRAPWGYQWRPASDEERGQGAPKVVLEIDEVAAPYVRSLFERAAAGETFYSLATWVAGLPDAVKGVQERTVRQEDGTTVKQQAARILSPSAVRQILAARVYVAQFAQDEEHHGAPRWPALIDQRIWDTVQRRFASQKGKSGPVNDHHLLTRLAKCPKCGHSLSGWQMVGKSKRYRCHAREAGGAKTRDLCVFSITGDPIDALVLAQVRETLSVLDKLKSTRFRAALDKAWARVQEPDADILGERVEQIREARATIADAKSRILKGTQGLVDGLIEPDAYKALAAAEQARMADAQKLLQAPDVAAMPTALPSLDEVIAEFGSYQAILDGPTATLRPLLRSLITSVTPSSAGYRQYQISIEWSPTGAALREVGRRLA